MLTKESIQNEPFWMDEPNPYPHAGSDTVPKGGMTWWFYKIFQIYAIFFQLFIFFLFVFIAILYPVFWIFAVLLAVIIAGRIFLQRFKETPRVKALRIQQLAKERTRADLLGSAIHTAGHPLLQVNQSVVLALKGSELSIYSYDSPIPLDTLSIHELHAVSPIVFDDDHVPYVGILDNTAQALQISFHRYNVECLSSFRRMYKVRPIEWYHAIQKARFVEKPG